MSDLLPLDSEIAFRLIRSYPGIKGRYLTLDTGFTHDRCIDAVKELVLRDLVYPDLSGYPDFTECRLYAKL